MRIVYHLGAHFTDEERLLHSLLRNHHLLSAHGILVPAPERYRERLSRVIAELNGDTASPTLERQLLAQLQDNFTATRIILSDPTFMGPAETIVRGGLYPDAAARLTALTNIFPSCEAEFHFALRSPATLLPSFLSQESKLDLNDMPQHTAVEALSWADLIAQINQALPEIPLTIWRDEDTPMLWPEVLQSVSGNFGDTLLGQDALLRLLMRPEGLTRMRSYFDANPALDPPQRRRVVAAFLAKFARPERVEQDIDIPGWSAETLARLDAKYLEDIAQIRAIPNVTFLSP